MEPRYLRIFKEIPPQFNSEVNHYISKLKTSCAEKTLPLLYGPYLRGKKGNWLDCFHLTSEELLKKDLVLEIGCHKGSTLCKIAADHKELAFLGMDITYKRVYETAFLAESQKLLNVKAILGDAKEMEAILAPEELSGVIIFFPDPWLKKKKQKKNRLINKDFCAILKKVLKKTGVVWFKTDSEEYFIEAQSIFKKSCFVEATLSDTFFSKNYESTFEARFKKKSCTTYESFWIQSNSL